MTIIFIINSGIYNLRYVTYYIIPIYLYSESHHNTFGAIREGEFSYQTNF